MVSYTFEKIRTASIDAIGNPAAESTMERGSTANILLQSLDLQFFEELIKLFVVFLLPRIMTGSAF